MQALESLKIVACHVLDVEGGTKSCELHKKLFDVVKPTAVITFNYDLIADQSLLALGKLNWHSAEYRCATHAAIPTNSGRDAYKRLWARHEPDAIPFLKLHGSMHYEKLKKGSGFRLSGTELPNKTVLTFRYLKVPSSPYLIPPVAAKIEIRQRELRDRWYSAVDYLHKAPVWIIWGYSFPITDTISQVLFKTALSRNRKSKPVIVVDPDASVPKRIIEVCRKVNVRHYSSMERLLMDLDVL